MLNFSLGIIILNILFLLIVLGFGHRALDRLYLSDRAALFVIIAMIIGSFFDIPIDFAAVDTSINIGGGLIPLILVIYILVKAGTAKERIRAITASIITAAVLVVFGSLISGGHQPGQGEGPLMEPLIWYPLIAGITAYVFGRSRRGAFIAAVLGTLALPAYSYYYLTANNIDSVVSFGGGGIMGTVVLAGIIAVIIAEIVGEFLERMQGGSKKKQSVELQNALSGEEISEELGVIIKSENQGDDNEK